MQASPIGMASASQADFGGFDSRRLLHVIHLLQSEPPWLDSNRCFSVFCMKIALICRYFVIFTDIHKSCIWTVKQQTFSFTSVNHENPLI